MEVIMHCLLEYVCVCAGGVYCGGHSLVSLPYEAEMLVISSKVFENKFCRVMWST